MGAFRRVSLSEWVRAGMSCSAAFVESIALQPVSVEGQNGLNVAAGIAELTNAELLPLPTPAP